MNCTVSASTRTAASGDRCFGEGDRALRARLDDDADVAAAFQMQVWGVLAKQVALFTMGESTSIPEYDAYRLLASTCFVLDVDTDDPDAGAMLAVLDEGAEAVFARNLRRIEERAAQVDGLWKEVCLNMPLLESVALRDTLESLRNFAARYDPRFFAHEIPADIDYPLCRPVSESLQGVAYVTTYLERLLAECRFLQRFELERCRAVLRRVHPAYGELIVNLFEPVATNAVGCALANSDVRFLRVGEEGRARIAQLLASRSAGERRTLLREAADGACDELGLCGSDAEATRELVRWTADGLVPRLGNALRHESLDGVFVL